MTADVVHLLSFIYATYYYFFGPLGKSVDLQYFVAIHELNMFLMGKAVCE